MLFDSLTLACLRDEIATAALDAAIRDVHQPRRLEIVLELDAEPRYLVLSAEAERARVHLARERPPTPERAWPFAASARKRLRGARIVSIEQAGLDRVLRIGLDASAAAPSLDPACGLIIETMGKHSNVILLNNVDQVLDALKHVPPDVSRARTILPHGDYVPPPTRRGRDPRAASLEDLTAVVSRDDAPWSRALAKEFEGLSPILLEEIARRAEVSPDAIGAELPAGGAERVASVLEALLEDVRARRWSPVRFRLGERTGLYPLPLGADCEPVASLSLAIAEQADRDRERLRRESLRSEVRSAIDRSARRVEEALSSLRAQEGPERADDLRRQGEALAASFGMLRQGMERIAVPDPRAPEEPPLEIALDPRRAPGENLARLFDRARRLETAARLAPERIARAEAELASLRALAERTRVADEAALAALRSEALGLGVRFRGEKSVRDERGQGFPTRTSSDGFEIVFARSAEESDALLRTASAPDDWWLHARDARGGHVIVRSGKQPDRVPRNTLVEAARLAAFLSKSRHSALAPVDYTLRKYVRKARRGPKGLHIFEREKTLMVEPLGSLDEDFGGGGAS